MASFDALFNLQKLSLVLRGCKVLLGEASKETKEAKAVKEAKETTDAKETEYSKLAEC